MRRAIWITGTFVILASILVLFVLDSCSAASKKFGTQAPAVTPAASAAPVGRGTQPPVAETAPTAGVKPGDDAVDFAGTYVATLTPGAFALRAVTLTLLSNLGAEMMTEYVDGRAAVVEAGSWGPSGTSGRVRLAISRRTAESGAKPEDIIFELREGRLHAVDYPKARFGTAGISLVRQSSAMRPTSEAQTEVADATFSGSFGGLLSDASGINARATLTLTSDGAALMTTDYGKDTQVLIASGSWEAMDRTHAAIRITSAAHLYSEPVTSVFVLEGDTLTGVEWDRSIFGSTAPSLARSAQSKAALTEGPQGSQAQAPSVAVTAGPPNQDGASGDFAGIYAARVPTGASPGLAVSLTLAAGGRAAMTSDFADGNPPVIEEGAWVTSATGNQVTVTLAGQSGQPYDNPVVIVLQIAGSDLRASQFDSNVYGPEGFTLKKASAEVTQPPQPSHTALPALDFTGVYSGSRPAASGKVALLMLSLEADMSAILGTDLQNGKGPAVVLGKWKPTGNDNIQVTLQGTDGAKAGKPDELLFVMRGDTLVALTYDTSTYGDRGLRLTRMTFGSSR